MNIQKLIETAGSLVAGGKGLLAMDESNPTCNNALRSKAFRRPWTPPIES